MNRTDIAKIVKEEYKIISTLITEKKDLERKIKLMTEAAEVDEILNLEDMEAVWREFFPGEEPVESEEMVNQLYNMAQEENLSILDLMDSVPQFAENDYISETSGIGTSFSVKNTTPQINENKLRSSIRTILMDNLTNK